MRREAVTRRIQCRDSLFTLVLSALTRTDFPLSQSTGQSSSRILELYCFLKSF